MTAPSVFLVFKGQAALAALSEQRVGLRLCWGDTHSQCNAQFPLNSQGKPLATAGVPGHLAGMSGGARLGNPVVLSTLGGPRGSGGLGLPEGLQ